MVGKRLKSLFSFIEAFRFCKGRKQLKHSSSEQAVVARHCRQWLLGVMACVVRSVCVVWSHSATQVCVEQCVCVVWLHSATQMSTVKKYL